MGKYLSHAQMKKYIKKVKGINESAKILGLDVGRKYTGVAITDKEITNSFALRTLIIDP